MKSVWIDASLVRDLDELFQPRCVVCGKQCETRVVIRATTTNPIVGGLGYLLGATRKFRVPLHTSTSCAREAKVKLFKRESVPSLLLMISAVTFLVLAIILDRALIFGIFGAFIIVGLLDFYLESKKDWWVRINESPSDGLVGAYEFQFFDEEYADEFRAKNAAFVTN